MDLRRGHWRAGSVRAVGDCEEPHETIHLDEVTHWGDGKQYNCYVLVLTHPPITRWQRVAPHRFLWFTWGDDEADVTRTQTIFRFSRPETKAAKAIRTSLEKGGLPHEQLRFKERSREERTGGDSGLFGGAVTEPLTGRLENVFRS